MESVGLLEDIYSGSSAQFEPRSVPVDQHYNPDHQRPGPSFPHKITSHIPEQL